MVSQHALQQVSGGWYPSMPCRWYPSMPCKGGLQAHFQGEVEGSGQGGSLGPHLEGGSPGPHPGGVCVSQHALRQTPPHGQLLLRAVRILLECILVTGILLKTSKSCHL